MSDYISREAAKKKHCDICRERNLCYRANSCADLKCFDIIPAADVREVKRGRWINQGADSEICSACGSRFYISALFAVGINDEPNFCSNCGAKMCNEEEDA